MSTAAVLIILLVVCWRTGPVITGLSASEATMVDLRNSSWKVLVLFGCRADALDRDLVPEVT